MTRLAEQGFDIRFNDAPTMRHDKGFNVPLVQQHNLYYLPATIMNLGQHQQLQLRHTQKGMIAMIAPTTLTSMDRNKSLEATATIGTTTMKDTLYGITGTRGRLSLFLATIVQYHWRH